MGRLLDLPDELLDPIMDELQFTHVTTDGRDLQAYQRRGTNREREDLEKLSYTCKRLRSIAISHLKRHPDLLGEKDANRPIARGTTSLQLSGSTCIRRLADAPLEGLVDLSLAYNHRGDGEGRLFDDAILGTCLALQSLVVHGVDFDDGEVYDTMKRLALLPKLQAFTFFDFREWDPDMPYGECLPAFISSYAQWVAPLTRLEIHTGKKATLATFFGAMQYFASTLQIAILRIKPPFILWRPHAPPWPPWWVPPPHNHGSLTFEALWRVMFSSDVAPGSFLSNKHLAALPALLNIWSLAPQLTCLECTPAVKVSSPAQLQQIADLRSRSRLEYARVMLKTWKGPKGAEWTDDEMQEIKVG